jgi:glycosyltransferase involved in cell wall biosynthesis
VGRVIIGVDGRELQGSPTGTGRYLRNLLRVWSRTIDDGLFVYFNGPPPADPVLDHPRIVARGLPRARMGLVWQERRLARAARADAVDVLFSPAYTCPLGFSRPRVTTVHDLSFFSVPEDFTLGEGFRRRLMVAASMRASAAILAVSEFTRREIARWFPDLADRVVHVPHGADDDLPPPPPRDEARARLGLRGPLLLSVGAIFNRRCLPVLLRAVSRLVRRHPGLVLDVVGENRTVPPLDLPRAVRALGLDGQVRLGGFVSDQALADRYAAADAAVFLSEYEGFGLPALEAMARGVPVVVSSRPALGEIFGGAGLTVEPRDEPGVERALDRVLSDERLRGDLRARGLSLAAGFSWDDTARRTREALGAAAGR